MSPGILLLLFVAGSRRSPSLGSGALRLRSRGRWFFRRGLDVVRWYSVWRDILLTGLHHHLGRGPVDILLKACPRHADGYGGCRFSSTAIAGAV